MIQARKISTTTYPIVFFMADSADHVTGKTGLTVTVTISKNGGSFGAASGAVAEIANGWYSLAGNATDRNTLGALAIHAAASGADPADVLVQVVSYDPFGLTADVWDFTTRTLTSAGGATAQQVWEYATRALTDKAGFSLTSAYDAAKTAASVDDLSGATVYFSGPMTTGNDIRLVRGDDYYDADGRALTWTIADIDMTGMTAIFTLGPLSVDCDIAGSVVTAELSADDTALLSARNYEYRLALYSGGHKLTEIIANCAVM